MPFFFPKGNFRRQKTAETRKTKTTKKKPLFRVVFCRDKMMRRDKNRYVRPGVLWYRLYSVFLYSLLLFLSFSVLCGGFLLVFSFSYVCHHPECVCVCVCSNGNHYRRQQERKKKQQLSSRLSNDSPRALAPVLVSCAQEAKSRGSSRPSALA